MRFEPNSLYKTKQIMLLSVEDLNLMTMEYKRVIEERKRIWRLGFSRGSAM